MLPALLNSPSAQNAPQDWIRRRQLVWARRRLQCPGTNDPRTDRQRVEVTKVGRTGGPRAGRAGGLLSFSFCCHSDVGTAGLAAAAVWLPDAFSSFCLFLKKSHYTFFPPNINPRSLKKYANTKEEKEDSDPLPRAQVLECAPAVHRLRPGLF